MRHFIAQGGRFAIVGLAATATHFLVAFLLIQTTPLSALIANTLAFLIAFIVSASGHILFTFRVESGRSVAVMRWFITSVGALLVSNFILYALIDRANWPGIGALAVAVAIVPPTSFVFSRLWAFRQ